MTNKKKILIISTIISLIIIIFGIIVTFFFTFKVPLKEISVKKLSQTSLPFISRSWYYFLYFTIHSNFMVLIYLFLSSINVIQPNQKKSHKIFEGICLLNIFITFFIYWTVLSWSSDVWNYPLSAIKSVLNHLIIPILMFVNYFFSSFKEKKTIELSYKDFYWFLIYPITWLILAIILYFSSVQDIYGFVTIKNNIKPSPEQLGGWRIDENPHTKHWIIPESNKAYVYKRLFSAGYALYFFFDFKNVIIWLPISVFIGISILFIVLSLYIIKTTKNTNNKINKKVI